MINVYPDTFIIKIKFLATAMYFQALANEVCNAQTWHLGRPLARRQLKVFNHYQHIEARALIDSDGKARFVREYNKAAIGL